MGESGGLEIMSSEEYERRHGAEREPSALSLEQINELFYEFLTAVARPRRKEDEAARNLSKRLRDHLGTAPADRPVVKAAYPPYDLPNVHLALERWFAADGRSYELVGMRGAQHHGELTLGDILEAADRYDRFTIGAVDYAHLPISPDEELACVSCGFYLGADGENRFAVLLRGPADEYGRNKVEIEVLAQDKEFADRLLAEIDRLVREHNIFQGQVLSFEGSQFGHGLGPFRFHRRPALTRDDIVLPKGLLERVERQVVGVARRREQLRAAGQHLRRGLLLYGPPGTGKTHTIRYLLSHLPQFTVVVLAGTSIDAIGPACALARMLQPALVVLEDCDLIAEARDHGGGEQPLLFQVLNEMDGLGDDADVAFLLTTNRADLLEPALIQRPGRVDLAVEIPLPDAQGRGRLLDLYGAGLDFGKEIADEVVSRTEGTTASFTKELVRRSVLIAAERESPRTEPSDLRTALDELLSDRDQLTRRLLGVRGPEDGDEDADGY
ncbi:ATPase family associated with various cellular activities (AAA) [Streptomyces sp. 3213]|uniref:AAA family ATPase n=1 Tax=Streptomyces sp. 3213.3 TaxID=1855348 RepID=UPI000895B9AD|nr:ATP-binding protein [Streptomyces sp. 3213.3]SEE50420.1 ATPase family associated with various cellular activities (AAA) [Streptomyces sp. 3213] [Streptomyces sp. 3213.3]